jgi:hypothetical protein
MIGFIPLACALFIYSLVYSTSWQFTGMVARRMNKQIITTGGCTVFKNKSRAVNNIHSTRADVIIMSTPFVTTRVPLIFLKKENAQTFSPSPADNFLRVVNSRNSRQ